MYKKDLEEGGYICVACSIDDEQLVPKQESQYVRGRVLVSGFSVQPIKGDEDHCELIYIFQGTLKKITLFFCLHSFFQWI